MQYTVEYFAQRTKRIENDCLVWQGSIRPNGYSRLAGTTAHRIIYEIAKGPIPKELQINHICRNKLCVNPDHLEAVTAKANSMYRAVDITHCKRGHELSGSNLYMTPDNRRQCKRCRAGATRNWSIECQ